ncbi:MAG: TetR/AcrR family transcriptional regulator [Saprospiraceae bacterium]|nr:TetR/AcrR family transcriptional regulator [Saprospiraceae bacterium]
MKTKDKILQEALKQFNERGTDAVSIRSIGDAVGISAGNLAYHFKNTDAIIYQLYLNLAEALNQQVAKTQDLEMTLHNLAKRTKETFQILFIYRFLLIDFVHINRRVEGLQKHFLSLMDMRKMQFRFLFELFQQKGLFRKDITNEQYAELSDIIILYSNAWVSDGIVRFKGTNEALISHYARLFFMMTLPYLSAEGKGAFEEVLENWESM